MKSIETIKLSIVIPYYNEENRLFSSLDILFDFLKDKENYEIIYVNDGSTDQTESVLKIQIAKRQKSICNSIKFRFLGYDVNKGKGFAVKQGICAATGEFVLYTDFDFAISLKEIVRFLDAIEKTKKSIIIASRLENSIAIQRQSFLRKFLGRVFNRIMKLIVKISVADSQCGFKMFRTSDAKEIFACVEINGFAFDVEVLYRALLLNISIIPLGVEIKHDDKFSKVNVIIDPVFMLCDLIKLKWRIFWSEKK